MKLRNLVLAAVLTAMAIIIPLIMPIKLVLPPASYTLASHVPIFIGMLISPIVGIFVALGSTLGFFLNGLPVTVVLRAASHLVWVIPGAILLAKPAFADRKLKPMIVLFLVISAVHAVAESVIILPFVAGWQEMIPLLSLYALGYFAHSMLDFAIAWLIYIPLRQAKLLK